MANGSGHFSTNGGFLVPPRLKEPLLGGEDFLSVHFGYSESTARSSEHGYAVSEIVASSGTPYFYKGESLGCTNRTVQVDRKTWDLFKSRSLGRTSSCEFSAIEQANHSVSNGPTPTLQRAVSRLQRSRSGHAFPHLSVVGLPVLSPFNKFARGWMAFISIVDLTFTAFLVPYITAFLSKGDDRHSMVLGIVDFVSGGIFLFDIFIKFHIGFVVSCDYRTKVEMRGKHIAWYYFVHGGAWIDLVSVLPSVLGVMVVLLGPLTKHSPVHLIRYIRMIRIVRLVRALSHTSRLTTTESSLFRLFGPTAMHLLSVVYCLLVLVNFLGCLLYFVAVAENSHLEDTWISKYNVMDMGDTRKSDVYHYLLAVYWAVTTVTTVGYGDVTPQTWIELLLMAFIMLTQIIIFGFLIGTMTEIVTNSMKSLRQAEKYKSKMESVEEWLMHYDIPDNLVAGVKAFYSQVWLRKQDVEESKILDELPISIRSAIVHSLMGGTLEALPLFRYMHKSVLLKIASKMTPVVKYPDDEVMDCDRSTGMLYLLEDGTVSLVASKGVKHQHSAPDVFGTGYLLGVLSSFQPSVDFLLPSDTFIVWSVKAAEVLEVVDTYENGRELLLAGFHQLMKDRIALHSDDRALEKRLEIELGRKLSAVAAEKLREELLKEQLDFDAFISVLATNEQIQPQSGTVACTASILIRCNPTAVDAADDAQASAAFIGSEDDDCDNIVGHVYKLLLPSLRKRGVQGAVEFVVELSVLGDGLITLQMLALLLEKHGIDNDVIASFVDQQPKGRNCVAVSTVASQLMYHCRVADIRKSVKNVFSQIFPGRTEIGLSDIADKFNYVDHPDVKSGVKVEAQVLREAIAVLLPKDICTVHDFVFYHQLVALCCPTTSTLEECLHQIWKFRHS